MKSIVIVESGTLAQIPIPVFLNHVLESTISVLFNPPFELQIKILKLSFGDDVTSRRDLTYRERG